MTCTVITGDVREVLPTIPSKSVKCVVTSPPYYGLRDYGVVGQIGLEPTLAGYITGMVEVFRLVRDVLADDGTVWLNIGDSYAAARAGHTNTEQTMAPNARGTKAYGTTYKREGGPRDALRNGYKHKDLMMVPARLAIALQDDGWYLRSDIIWQKPNPMPESVTDRPTSAHEHIFLLTKSTRYYYDASAIAEPIAESTAPRLRRGQSGKEKWMVVPGQATHSFKAERDYDQGRSVQESRNCRNVWTISTQSFSGAHFAVFPAEIPRRCILAGSREGDTILDPFAGAGTTLMVADRLNRNAIGIELNSTYADMARKRIYNDAPLFQEVPA